MKTVKPFVSALVWLAAAASVARADVVPPDVADCQSAKAGASCRSGAGTCVTDTCSKLDYANWNRDASASPPTVQYTCLRCVSSDGGLGGAGGASAQGGSGGRGGTSGQMAMGGTMATGGTTAAGGTTATGGTTAAGGTGGQSAVTSAPATGGTGGQGGVSVAGGSAIAAAGGAGGSGGSDGSQPDNSTGCAVGGWLSAKALAPWLLAGLFGAIVMLARRRRR